MEASKSKEVDERGQYYRQRMQQHGKKQKEFHTPSAMLMFDLLYSYDVVAGHLSREVGKLDLSLSAFNLLMILLRSDGKSSPLHELSERLLVSRANITGLVDCLEVRGLVNRLADHTDRRVRLAHLTPAGEQLLESFLPQYHLKVRQLCSGLSDEEKATVSDLLTKWRCSIREEVDESVTRGKAKR
jgi:MarR family 2-MHQ and catechol resistance regulon transcriptional repressor